MSSSYNGSSAGPIADPLTIPDDGDDLDAASVNIALQPLQNTAAFLAAKTILDAAGCLAQGRTNSANQNPVRFDASVTLGAACALTGIAGCSVTGPVGFGAGLTITCTAGAAITGNLALAAGLTMTCAAGATIAGAYTQTASRTKSGSAAVDVGRNQVVSSITASTTVSTSADTWWVDTPSVNMTWTLKSTSPTPPEGAEIDLVAYSTTLTEYVTVKREDASTVITLGQAGNGTATVKFINGKWGLTAASLSYAVGTAY